MRMSNLIHVECYLEASLGELVLCNFFFNILGSQPDTTSWNIAWFTLCQKEEGGGRESKM